MRTGGRTEGTVPTGRFLPPSGVTFVIGGQSLEKGKLKKVLALVSVTGLIAGGALTMTGCKSAGSCGSSCAAKAEQAQSSCSAGSCSAGSCGAKQEEK
jgi:hypothetical protein